MHTHIPGYLLIAILAITLFPSCQSRNARPEDIELRLSVLSENERQTFENLLDHYLPEGDSLKIKSCYFIINNIAGIGSLAVDKEQQKVVLHKDTKYITTDYLIEQIDNAVDACRTKIVKGSLSFTDFCNYVLPYRIDYEPLENWRKKIQERYTPMLDSLGGYAQLSDTSLCRIFNKQLVKGFVYKGEGNYGDIKNWTALSSENMGNCAEMCKTVLFPLRSYGVPATVDFTPSWGNVDGGGHEWNVLLQNGGKNVPFMGLESDPYQYEPFKLIDDQEHPEKSTYRVPGKVYRRQFEINPNSLVSKNTNQERIPELFNDYRIKDVTAEYFPVANIDVHFTPAQLNNKQHAAYLAVFTNGTWKITAYSLIDDKGNAHFKDMTRNILYMPVLLKNDLYEPVGHPVYADSTGIVKVLEPQQTTIDVAVTQLRSKEAEEVAFIAENQHLGWGHKMFTDGLDKIKRDEKRAAPERGQAYTLYYWKDKWEKVNTLSKQDGTLVFNDVPANGLYRVTASNGKQRERCFTVANGVQQWW
ncbi:hypothetical protein [Chitinophaga rhizophila]|uniref:Transglutaminase superfamily protein n=1 Tax=Chitinophaga rhizophila TaxID=2866212 RepID=A0ABS7G7R5_9BACT|nr:hypothetical protein [Chitinophaga rhizophila]MBW8683180.1 hypothetical protein [Chitinophaga rhizophila]